MKQRNPRADSQLRTEANARKTAEVIEGYRTIHALLQTWDGRPMAEQCRNHGYILKLRAKERKFKNLLEHRSGPDSDIL